MFTIRWGDRNRDGLSVDNAVLYTETHTHWQLIAYWTVPSSHCTAMNGALLYIFLWQFVFILPTHWPEMIFHLLLNTKLHHLVLL